MATEPLIQYNSILPGPACRTVSPCLWEVAGHVNNDPADQLSICQSLFGLPQVATVTLAADPVFSTETETSTYTDIIVDVSTVYSTAEQVSTSYETDYATATVYTTTSVETLTATVPAAVGKRGNKHRRGCRPRTSASPASTVPSQSPSSSSSSAAPSSTADACADLTQHSSACACLEPATVTSYYDAVTSIIYSTEPVTVQSTSNAVVTIAVTTVIVEPATTTLTSTLSTETDTTATATATAAPAAPTTFTLEIGAGVYVGQGLLTVGSAPAYTVGRTTGPPTQLGLSAGALSVLVDPIYKMYVRLSTSSYGVVYMTTEQYVATSAYTFRQVTCSVDASTLSLSCSTVGGFDFDRFLSCGSLVYMADPTTTPGGCTEIQLDAVRI